MSESVLDWLAAGDPAIRWQVERDLLDLNTAIWGETRTQISHVGWGRELLARQDPGGTWGGGLYSPKWISTTYTLLLLRRLGLASSNDGAISGSGRLLDDATWVEGGVSYWSGSDLAERCVNGMVLSLVSYFDVGDPRADSIAELLLSAVMLDGGWNCRDHQGATHSSFHTTISVLEGLMEWQRRTGRSDADTAIARGHEFMLGHRMYRSHRTGQVINEAGRHSTSHRGGTTTCCADLTTCKTPESFLIREPPMPSNS